MTDSAASDPTASRSTSFVRRAGPDDEDAFRTACIGFDPPVAELPSELFHRRYQALVGREDYCLPMAVRGDQVIGYALAQDYGPNLRLRFTIGRLHDLWVDPDCRRQGVGRLLMEHVFAWARGRPEPMILHWQASRTAIEFYESLGLVADHVGDYPDYPGFSLDLRDSR